MTEAELSALKGENDWGTIMIAGVDVAVEMSFSSTAYTQFGTSGYDFPRGIATDSIGNIYVPGLTGGSFPGYTNSGSYDAYIAKYSASGTQIWMRQFGTSGNDSAEGVEIDSSGNIYLSGCTGGSLPGNSNLGNEDAYIAKYDTNGNQLWVRQFGTFSGDRAYKISIDNSSNLYLSGMTFGTLPGNSSAGNLDAYVAKYDTNGNQLWIRQFGSPGSDEISGISTDSSGNAYVAGFTYSSLPGNSLLGEQDAYVAKYDTNGNRLWIRQFGTTNDDRAWGISTDSSGNVYVSGETWGTLSSNTSSGSLDAYIAKYDTNGNPVWIRQFGTSNADYISGASTDSSGNIYVTGYTYGAFSGYSNAGGLDAYVAKYDTNGNRLWVRQFGTSSDDYGNAVAPKIADVVYASGFTYGSLPGNSNAGQSDTFLVRLDASTGNFLAGDFPVNKAPTDLNISATSINENVAANSIVGTLSTIDPDAGNTFTYSLVSGTGSTDNASFSIVGNQLRINVSPDYETKNSYSIRVRTTDQGGASYEEVLSIAVNNINEAPVLVNNATIPVNQGNSVVITSALLQATDQDNTAAQLTYTLTSLPIAGTLRLDGNALAIGGKFTQDDINNSRVTYLQNGSSTVSDNFSFTVSDGIPSTLTLVSTNASGIQGNSFSSSPILSANGRYVAFYSSANNLVSGDSNGVRDVFVKDLETGSIARASTNSSGLQSDADSFAASISSNGRYVAFSSESSNLVDGDTNNESDIFVKDLQTGTMTRASTSTDGTQGNNYVNSPAGISGDGRYVAFTSNATNLDANGASGVFVKDLQTGILTRVSTAANGVLGNGSSIFSGISADGRYVSFWSNASNLVSGDTNNVSDVFVKDLQTGQIVRASTATNGTQANNYSGYSSLSADGRYIAFYSNASNLVGGDTNNATDVFIKDLQTGNLTLVSANAGGAIANGESGTGTDRPGISADGRYVSFSTSATNLSANDTHSGYDVYVKDLQTGNITLISALATVGGGQSYESSLSADGQVVAFDRGLGLLASRSGVEGSTIAGTSAIAINAVPTDLTISASSQSSSN
jgi:hypothetical protein